MTTVTFYAPTRFAYYVQLLVKKYDGRYAYNPSDMFQGTSRFVINFENNEAGRFMHMTHILNQPWV